jgi:hypothetical protein
VLNAERVPALPSPKRLRAGRSKPFSSAPASSVAGSFYNIWAYSSSTFHYSSFPVFFSYGLDPVFLTSTPEGGLIDAQEVRRFLERLGRCKDSSDMLFFNLLQRNRVAYMRGCNTG